MFFYLFVFVLGLTLGYVLRIVRPVRYVMALNPSVKAVEGAFAQLNERFDRLEAANAAAIAAASSKPAEPVTPAS